MFWKSKEDDKANSQQQQQQQQQQYDDIPIITDAEVVEAEVVQPSAAAASSAPPAMNPNYHGSKTKAAPTMASSAPGAYQMTSPAPNHQQQPVNMHVNTHMVAVSQTNMVKPLTQLGRNPTGLQCPHCGRQTVTVVEDYVGVGTVVSIIVLAILFWPLCWLPLCVPTCKRTHHYCGHQECQKKVGETRVCA